MRFELETLKKAVGKLRERGVHKAQPVTDYVTGKVYFLSIRLRTADLAIFQRRGSTFKFDLGELDYFLFSVSEKPAVLTCRSDGATFDIWSFRHPVYGEKRMVDITPSSCGSPGRKTHEDCVSFQSCTCPCDRCFAIHKFYSRRYQQVRANSMDFMKVVKKIAVGWVPNHFGDPNMGDAEMLGSALAYAMKIPPPPLPSRKTGLEIVNVIERRMVGLTLIRDLSSETLMDRIFMSIGEIQLLDEMPVPATYSFIYGLGAWGACISAMKATRPAYGMKEPVAYDQDLRWMGYYSTQYSWKQAFLHGNPWPRFGVSLAKEFALSRGDTVIDDWIPRESPYFDDERLAKMKELAEAEKNVGPGWA